MPQTKTAKRSTGSTSKRASGGSKSRSGNARSSARSNGGSAKKGAAKTRSSSKSTKSRPTASKSRSDGLADKAKVAGLAGGAALIGLAGGAVATRAKAKGPLGLLGRRSRMPKLKAPTAALRKVPKAGAALLPKTNGSAFDWVEEKAKEVGDASYRLAAATSEAHRVKNSLTDGK